VDKFLNHLGYFTIRDVYPTSNVGVSTREKTKINSNDIETPTEVTETKAEGIAIENSVNTKSMAKFFIGLVLVGYLVNRFGK
jgi:hypothetical protein